ncbi:hypothetical protein HLH34_10470 [Gluconacetobacter azotocaptans]|uniref:DUF2214 domain-containing protein n=1 Tax=Gluconacetobacter azotocaptans TaxID=142834 RepID=A0A7W4PE32_9PROT|nr:hypothetical protein [Gluconacetobacter azotocaptans]MBB2190378.1 hypothetical protein [Gluconacetobacter azotocaptans]MBM9400585.1 hypothetical protein [Gluconacetobacter azotocaptans]GBQ30087.1 hypothetical protein AA13594_1601 [Gluconacetobacter azotocaptans DSM 13594]
MISHPLAFMRLPYDVLVAMDSRMYHYWMQPVHYLVRTLHILSMAGFFGMDLLFGITLCQNREKNILAAVSRLLVRWVHSLFAVAMITGVALFFYDPVHIGSRAYLTPKLLFIVLAMGLAAIGHRRVYLPALAGRGGASTPARVVAVASVVLWSAVIVASCLNSEGVPKVFLR